MNLNHKIVKILKEMLKDIIKL